MIELDWTKAEKDFPDYCCICKGLIKAGDIITKASISEFHLVHKTCLDSICFFDEPLPDEEYKPVIFSYIDQQQKLYKEYAMPPKEPPKENLVIPKKIEPLPISAYFAITILGMLWFIYNQFLGIFHPTMIITPEGPNMAAVNSCLVAATFILTSWVAMVYESSPNIKPEHHFLFGVLFCDVLLTMIFIGVA